VRRDAPVPAIETSQVEADGLRGCLAELETGCRPVRLRRILGIVLVKERSDRWRLIPQPARQGKGALLGGVLAQPRQQSRKALVLDAGQHNLPHGVVANKLYGDRIGSPRIILRVAWVHDSVERTQISLVGDD
jgi:hypothetical protein